MKRNMGTADNCEKQKQSQLKLIKAQENVRDLNLKYSYLFSLFSFFLLKKGKISRWILLCYFHLIRAIKLKE